MSSMMNLPDPWLRHTFTDDRARRLAPTRRTGDRRRRRPRRSPRGAG